MLAEAGFLSVKFLPDAGVVSVILDQRHLLGVVLNQRQEFQA
jgi:hypothetical protein